MGEGWSDFYSLSLLAVSGADPHAQFPAGSYASRQWSAPAPYGTIGEANYFWGIRRYPYTTDMKVNPLTFKDIDPILKSAHASVPNNPLWAGLLAANEQHAMGEVWCIMLWEARARLIDRFGYEVGNQTILQLVTDGMKNGGANPNFIQARDAIISADLNNSGGAYR